MRPAYFHQKRQEGRPTLAVGHRAGQLACGVADPPEDDLLLVLAGRGDLELAAHRRPYPGQSRVAMNLDLVLEDQALVGPFAQGCFSNEKSKKAKQADCKASRGEDERRRCSRLHLRRGVGADHPRRRQDRAPGRPPRTRAGAFTPGPHPGRMAVDDSSNEITAIPRSPVMLDLKGAPVTIDAMGCNFEGCATSN